MFTKREYREQAQNSVDDWNDQQPSHRLRVLRARRGHRRSFYLISLSALFTLLISACPLYNPAAFIQPQTTSGGQSQTGPSDVLSTASQITLQWDPPASGASQVVSYTVSYRTHGTSTWNTLAAVPASAQPSYTVLRSAVGSGSFDFAVSAVDSTGASSPLHTSLDPTANPTSGWYLTW